MHLHFIMTYKVLRKKYWLLKRKLHPNGKLSGERLKTLYLLCVKNNVRNGITCTFSAFKTNNKSFNFSNIPCMYNKKKFSISLNVAKLFLHSLWTCPYYIHTYNTILPQNNSSREKVVLIYVYRPCDIIWCVYILYNMYGGITLHRYSCVCALSYVAEGWGRIESKESIKISFCILTFFFLLATKSKFD